MPLYQALSLGGTTLRIPYSNNNQYYQVEDRIVAGRQATALDGTLMELGVIRKRFWTITFFCQDTYDAVKTLMEAGNSCIFIDANGLEQNVYIIPPIQGNPYPHEAAGLCTVVLREV